MKKKINLFPSKINPFEKIYHTLEKKEESRKGTVRLNVFSSFFLKPTKFDASLRDTS